MDLTATNPTTPHALRILVIDDDPIMRELLETLLGFAGHKVQSVASGDEALPLLRSSARAVDVVLTDLHMPGLQGHELASELLNVRDPATLLVGMSGSHPSEEETHLLDHFLHKPFTPEQFEKAVRAARRKHESELLASSTAVPIARMAATTTEEAATVLDERVFERMSAMMPVDQLRGLYLLTVEDVLNRVERMKSSVVAGDLDAVRREAHSIKGGCGMVGATEIYALASVVEDSAAPNTFPLEKFVPACERLKRMLDERLFPAS